MPGGSAKEIGRTQGAVDEDGEETEVRSQIAQKTYDIHQKTHCNKEAVQRPAGQGVMRSWGWSHIENGEDEESWREGCQMSAQWKSWERRGIEGSSLKVEVMQKMPELLVHEHMSQGKGVKRRKREKESTRIVSSIDKRKNQIVGMVEDTEEIKKWRGLSQCEIDQCWKNLATKKGRGSSGQL